MRRPSRPRMDEVTKHRILRTLWSVAVALLGGTYIGAAVIWLFGLLGAQFLPQPYHFLAGFYATLGVGVIIVYYLVYMFKGKMPGFVVRVLWTLAALAHGTGTALDLREDGFEEVPLRRVGEGADHRWEVYRNGRWVEIERGGKHLTRLGLRPFGICFENSERLLEEWLAEFDAESFDADAMADGGDYYLLGEKGGRRRFVPVSWVEGDVDGHVLSHDAVYSTLLGAGGTKPADVAYEESLIKASKSKDMGQIVMVGYIIVMSLIGGLLGYMVVA